jgi:hypothetical protein
VCLGSAKCDFFVPTGVPIKCVWLSMFKMGNIPHDKPICQNPYHGMDPAVVKKIKEGLNEI